MRVYLKALPIVVAALAGLAGTAYPVRAQALGEVARKEEERRKDIKAPAKVYTNRDLGAAPAGPEPGTVSSSPAPAADAKAADAKATDAKATDAKDKEKAAPPRDQAYWSGRRKELLAKLESDQTFAQALQSRINALTTDFASRSDPVQRAGIERDRIKALSDLDRVRKSVEEDKKALAALDDEARKAGVPAGWLR
jgi:hypothetical protein